MNINLIYENHVVPYVIGILSHSIHLRQFSIETFVQISYLTEWIKETFQDLGEEVPSSLFDPLVCAERYLEQRQKIQGNLLVKKIDSVEYMVIIPDSSSSKTIGTCVGVLIRSDVVVTLAQCANYLIILSSWVILSDYSSKSIRDVFIHPGYKEDTFYNNIALLTLTSETSITPASMYFYSFEKERVALLGYKKRFFFEDLIETIAEAQQLSILFDDDCNPTQEQRSRLAEGLQVEHMCLRNEHYIVPGSCEARPGSPVVLSSDIGSVIGLSMSGNYCGFGEPAIVTLFHDHLVWISSVLETPPKEWFVFTIPGLKMSEVCVYPEGTVGTCVSRTSCPSVHQRVKDNLPIFFCTDKSIVCCPEDSATEVGEN
uniref:Peptidase S1 domain-containing protein n=1 Tax=Anopheles stephensi TaxID=30069 RepID=A0A182YRS0_ANOST